MRRRIAVTLAMLAGVASNAAWAGVTSFEIVPIPQVVLPDHVVSDLTIDFTGNLRGQRLVVDLDGGSIFQHPLGAQTLPSESLLAANPSLTYDTFLAIGGTTAESSQPLLDLTCTSLDPGACPHRFDDQAIYVAWAPATGVEIPAGDAFLTARLTLSSDAQGTLQYFSATAAGTGDPIFAAGTIHNGVISFVPEPASAWLVGFGASAMCLICRKRTAKRGVV